MRMCIAALAAATTGSASAGLVTLTSQASITQDGQAFVFSFPMNPTSASAGTLTIEALGDYSIVPPSSETMDWDIDGIASGQGFSADAFEDPNNVDLFQNAVAQTWTISESDMFAITADGDIMISIQNGASVGFFADQPEDFIRVTLEYREIPAPASLATFGIAGLMGARRRR